MPLAEITRAQTRERARLLNAVSYDITVNLTRGEKIFGSTSVISFGCVEPGAVTYADLIAAAVHEITLNGVPLDPAVVCADGRIELAGLAAHNELRVVADCAYASDGTALHRSVDSADGRVYCYTKFEPAAARRVFANFEQPDLKAEFTFHVVAPAHWTVLSGQPTPQPVPGADDTAADDGVATWHFAPTPRISTYLTVLAAGDYHLVTSSHTTPRGQVIPLGVACRQSYAPHLEADDIMAFTRQGLDYYTGLFQLDYPFAKYDQVFVPEFSSGAMENVGCVIFTDRLLFRSRVTDSMYERRASIILHEMAHMWFGDLVTMKWFDDLWLNESFADYCAALSSAEATRFTDAWTTFSGSRKTWGYAQDHLPSTHPIAADVPTVTVAVANFDGISYAKGASVLKQLVAYVGRENFFAGIRAYLAEHAWGNATLADLLRALEVSSGRDLGDWSKAWLETAGPNTLRPDFTVTPDGRFAEFAVVQEAPAEHPTLRPHRIAIGLYNRSADGALVRTHRVEVDVANARTAVPSLAGLTRPDLILINDDDLGYAVVRFDDRSLATLTESIGELTDGLARTVCWTAALDMVRQAELPVPDFAAILVGGMGAETSISILELLLAAGPEIVANFSDPRREPARSAQLAAEGTRLLRAAEPGSDRQLAWAQLVGRTATTDEQLDLIAGILTGNVAVPGLAVDAELRWALLSRLAATGRAGDAEIDAELARDETDGGRRSALACRAAIPDAEHKEAAWRLLTQDEAVGFETAMAVGHAFNQPRHAALLADYAERYFALLPEIWGSRSQQLRLVLGGLLFPRPAASAELIAQVNEFLAARDRDPGMVRLLVERRDGAERVIRSRALESSIT
ncbi:MAG: aminopeptidase N [Streptosporangiaceae bacterium]